MSHRTACCGGQIHHYKHTLGGDRRCLLKPLTHISAHAVIGIETFSGADSPPAKSSMLENFP